MSSPDNPLAWVERAEEDYITAQTILRRKTPFTDIACFHAQQCAEKYLKAILVARGQVFPKTHDLILLNEQCSQVGIFTGMEPKQLHALSDHAVQARYPGASPNLSDAHEAMNTAKAVRAFAREFLGIKP